MQKLFKLFVVALFATLSLSLVSCSDDDDNEGIVGTWKYAFDEYDSHYDGTLKFKSNNTFELNETEIYAGEKNTYKITGVYSLSGDIAERAVLIMTPTSVDPDDAETATVIARRAGDILYLSYDGMTVEMTKK